MAEKDDDSLIGYDPLAWLQNAEDEHTDEAASLADELAADAEGARELDAVVTGSDSENNDNGTGGEVKQAVNGIIAQPERVFQIMLDSAQTIQNVAQLHERLLQALNEHNKIDIDASEVAMIDTATLQLLLVLKQTALKMQKEVSIDFPSEKFIETAELLGLAEMLDVDQAAAGFF